MEVKEVKDVKEVCVVPSPSLVVGCAAI